MWAQQEQRSPGRIVSGTGSLKNPGKFEESGQERWNKFFSETASKGLPRPFNLTRQGGGALTQRIGPASRCKGAVTMAD
jgi:hypothetical protein